MRNQDNLRRLRREWYERNKVEESKKQVIRNRIKKDEARKYVVDYKESTPCMDCKKSYPHYVMDFDHRDPSAKRFSVGKGVSQRTLNIIKQEINKCDLVCANCHRIRTYGGRSMVG